MRMLLEPFGKLPPVVPRIARMRVRGGYVQMMASCPLVTSCWEWSGSSVRIAFGSVECKGWDYYCLYGPHPKKSSSVNNHQKKLEHEWKHHDLPRLPKDGDVPFHGEVFICVYLVKGTPSGSYWQLTVANILPKTLVTIGVMPWHLSWW